ncbi:MAG: SpoIIE family protein phosphatase [Acidimicrobiales bacterium]
MPPDAPSPAVDDPGRLRAVRRSGLLRGEHPNLERYARMAAAAIGAPVAMFSVVDNTEQRFVVQVGIDPSSPQSAGSSLDESYCRTVVETGAPLVVDDVADDDEWLDHPGTSHFGIGAYAGMPVRADDGAVLGSLCVVDSSEHAWSDDDLAVLRDLADAVEAELALRRTTRRLERLLERQRRKARFEQAMLAVASATNRSSGIQATADALIEHGAAVVDAAMITLGMVEDDSMVFHHGPGVADETMEAWHAAPLDLAIPMVEAARGDGEPIVLADPAALARYPLMAEDVEHMGLQAFVAMPVIDPASDLRAAIGLGWTTPLDHDDTIVEEIEPLGRLTAQALGRATRFDAARSQAQLLEQLIIPSSMPELEGVDLHARYLPPSRVRRVGGDLYDAVVRDDGAIGIIVADAVGHDLEASRTAARVRHAVGALTLEGVEPAALLAAVNHYLRRSRSTRLITCSYWLVHPDRRQVTLANAGHPQPRLVDARGAQPVGPAGQPLLGAMADVGYTQETITLPAEATLVGFTDGLIERRGVSLIDAEATFEERLATITPGSAKVLVDSLVAEVLPIDRDDDVAVVALAVTAGSTQRLSEQHEWLPEAVDLKEMRAVIGVFLARHDLDDLAPDATLIATELLANARVAAAPDVAIELVIGLDDAGFELVVRNRGDAFDDALPMPAPEAERGRGLAIIRAMARDVHVTFDDGLTTVTVRLDTPPIDPAS